MKLNIPTLLAASALALVAGSGSALAADSRDVVRLDNARLENGEWRVALHVQNSRELAGMDLPLRFAAADARIELVRVEFADRVADWDFTHAQIDHAAKTVVIGLISELTGARPAADLKVAAAGSTKVADLVFKVDGGALEIAPFTMEAPGHRLSYQYNELVNGELRVLEIDPQFETFVSLKEEAGQLPREYALSQAFPNPFNPSTSFTLSLPEASDYTLRIFNVAGQLVKSMEGHLEAGSHRVVWDGRSSQGQAVASGTYFFSAQAGDFAVTRKMTLLK